MTDKEATEHFEQIYKGSRPEEIPWNSEEPPELLVKLIEGGKVKQGRALDLGCGLGNYAIWLASKGFEVVGVDGSPTAIKKAKQNAKKRKAKCEFLVADLTGQWLDLGSPREINNLRIRSQNKPLISRGKLFDFVYDWGVLHHIPYEQRPRYIENVHKVLKPKGKYASLCFNEKDTAFEGKEKIRNTHLGTAVYLSSEDELKKLFSGYFEILDFRVLEIEGKVMTHIFNFCFMQRKD